MGKVSRTSAVGLFGAAPTPAGGALRRPGSVPLPRRIRTVAPLRSRRGSRSPAQWLCSADFYVACATAPPVNATLRREARAACARAHDQAHEPTRPLEHGATRGAYFSAF